MANGDLDAGSGPHERLPERHAGVGGENVHTQYWIDEEIGHLTRWESWDSRSIGLTYSIRMMPRSDEGLSLYYSVQTPEDEIGLLPPT